MTLKSIDEIGPQKNLSPNSETARINYAVRNRRLFEGQTRELRVDPVSSSIPPVGLNWFRRVATFYPEFMLAERPTLRIADNPRLEGILQEFGRTLFPVLQRSNVDMLKYGLGVIASHHLDPFMFVEYDRDAHYEVVDERGMVIADILVDITGDINDLERLVNVVTYQLDGENSWKQYRFQAGSVGEQLREIELSPRAGRQVALLEHNAQTTSIFDDLKDPIAQLTRIQTAVARLVKRNASPHLYGPSGMLSIDEQGRANLDRDGMFLPVEEGDEAPGYLQWDSKMEAATWQYDSLQMLVYAFSGLSPLLFDPKIQTGVLSGEALRRTALPFLARLNHYARINESAIEMLLAIWNANRAVNGVEVFDFSLADIEVEWAYDRIFEDDESEDSSSES